MSKNSISKYESTFSLEILHEFASTLGFDVSVFKGIEATKEYVLSSVVEAFEKDNVKDKFIVTIDVHGSKHLPLHQLIKSFCSTLIFVALVILVEVF